jgi:DNA-binding transcriptional MerR regulator
VQQPSEQPFSAPTPTISGPRRSRLSDVVRSQFKTREVVDLLGLSRRQLQYWAKTGLIEPSERTPGGHHRYSFDDLVALKATKRLIDAGVSVQKIRKSVSALQALLPRVGRPLSELVLVATGDVVLVFQDDTVFEAISGQEWVFEVADFEREVSAYRNAQHSGRHAEGGSHPMEQEEASTAAALPAKPGPRATRSDRRRSDEQDLGRTG